MDIGYVDFYIKYVIVSELMLTYTPFIVVAIATAIAYLLIRFACHPRFDPEG
jgi:hypothetical protein